jgi:hypothetical protein
MLRLALALDRPHGMLVVVRTAMWSQDDLRDEVSEIVS